MRSMFMSASGVASCVRSHFTQAGNTLVRERIMRGRLRVERRRIEDRYVDVVAADQHGNFGTAENHAFGAARDETGNHFMEASARCVNDDPSAQFLVDHAMQERASGLVGNDGVDSACAKTRAVEILLHRKSGSEKRYP